MYLDIKGFGTVTWEPTASYHAFSQLVFTKDPEHENIALSTPPGVRIKIEDGFVTGVVDITHPDNNLLYYEIKEHKGEKYAMTHLARNGIPAELAEDFDFDKMADYIKTWMEKNL